MTLPCEKCVVMALCNAKMNTQENKLGTNAYRLYHSCNTLSQYIDAQHKRKISKYEWKVSLRPIQEFFIKDQKTPYFLTDKFRHISVTKDGIII